MLLSWAPTSGLQARVHALGSKRLRNRLWIWENRFLTEMIYRTFTAILFEKRRLQYRSPPVRQPAASHQLAAGQWRPAHWRQAAAAGCLLAGVRWPPASLGWPPASQQAPASRWQPLRWSNLARLLAWPFRIGGPPTVAVLGQPSAHGGCSRRRWICLSYRTRNHVVEGQCMQ